MMLIDGKNMPMGRLATFVAKQALKGEEIKVLNADQVIITGNKKNIEEEFEIKRSRFGSSQKGPIHHANSEKIVKRAIRGMLPDHRVGRGKEAFKKIMCYNGIPNEFKDKELIVLPQSKKIKYSKVKEFTRSK